MINLYLKIVQVNIYYYILNHNKNFIKFNVDHSTT